MDKLSRTVMSVSRSEDAKLARCFFAIDFVLLAFSKSGFQHALNGFAAACDIAGIKIGTSKTEAEL